MNAMTQKSSQWNILPHIKYEHLAAGISGGVVSTLILHPFDLLKIRFAVNDGQLKTHRDYRGLRHAVVTIAKEEGFRGFYRGVTPNCWGAGASWGLYFLFYNAIKKKKHENRNEITLSAGTHMISAAEAGIFTLFLTNPIWVVKTRMCLQYSTSVVDIPTDKRYSGMLDALFKLYKYEGFRGLYKGMVPGIFGVSHGALQFMAYEEMKKYYVKQYNLPIDSTLGTLQYLTFAATSKLFAASVTYPYQVIRCRLQDQHRKYVGVINIIKSTWKHEGIRGFYKGLIPNLLKVTPATALTFVVYEKMSGFLLKKSFF